MPGTDFYRALATIKYVRSELLVERDAHNAMKMCFKKIHKSLDMYQGHFINRLRFHLNRHHTEYLRKVRVMRKEKSDGSSQEEEDTTTTALLMTKQHSRRSARVGIAANLANEVEHLKNTIKRKDLEIQRLAMLLDDAAKENDEDEAVVKEARPTTTSIRKLTNPYYPTDDDETFFTAAADTPKAE